MEKIKIFYLFLGMDQQQQIKQQYSADNLKPGIGYTDSLGPLKYPPSGSPLDITSRITPNEDSRSSNSNSQPPSNQSGPLAHLTNMAAQPSGKLGSPMTTPSLPPPAVGPSFIGHPGLSLSNSSVLPANHPSLMSSSSPPISTSVTTNYQSTSTTQTSNSAQFSSGQLSSGFSSLHRPHQEYPIGNSNSTRNLPQSNQMAIHQRSSPAVSSGSGKPSENQHLQRGSPLGSVLPGPHSHHPHSMLSHPMPLHLTHAAMGLGSHHPGHLGHSTILPHSLAGGPLPLLSGHQPPSALGSLMEVAASGRRSPSSVAVTTSLQLSGSTSLHNTTALGTSPATVASSLSRSSPLTQQQSQMSGSIIHRSSSPSSGGNVGLCRTSPLHPIPQNPLSSHHPSSMAAAAAAAERDRQIMRQQSPHITPPPTSTSNSSLMSSPLSKYYGQPPSGPNQRPLGTSPPPPPSHFRPGASPPVVRHPQMPLPLPILGAGSTISTPGIHPSQNPYPHHLLHPTMFYAPHYNPFNTHHPYSPYGPGFSYMKPPGAANLDGHMLGHPHPTSIPPPRNDNGSPHGSKTHLASHQDSKNKPPTPKMTQGGINVSSAVSNIGPLPGSSFTSSHQHPSTANQYESPMVGSKTSHMEALRAHAHAASVGNGGNGGNHSNDHVQVDTLDIDPDPEPPSPLHNERGPSPDAKPDDTECHRSQSAM
jgi:arginine-glutamic acid dipeptide repeats protein